VPVAIDVAGAGEAVAVEARGLAPEAGPRGSRGESARRAQVHLGASRRLVVDAGARDDEVVESVRVDVARRRGAPEPVRRDAGTRPIRTGREHAPRAEEDLDATRVVREGAPARRADGDIAESVAVHVAEVCERAP